METTLYVLLYQLRFEEQRHWSHVDLIHGQLPPHAGSG
jgi:hypothetical protein